ncbi:putative neutral amino acid permease protein [Colletotrichum sp. SAR 10_99]|nr:putative neutral amino acid permease protein [Colletotrichum sp. SAR 10_99]
MESRQSSDTVKMTQVDAIQDMWKKAAIAFEEICNESLQNGEIRDFTDVQKKIEESGRASFDDKSEAEDKWKSARDAGLGALNYLKMLVGIASQAATFIPIPAAATSITAAALTRVFEIPQAIRDYNDSIDEVFREVSSALAQFRIIQSMNNVDQELVMQIHRVLFARVDSTTRKALSPVCHEGPAAFRGSGKNRKLDTLWRQLKIGGSSSTAVYYLIFDGIENLDAEQAGMLLEFAFRSHIGRDPAKRVRFLVSATEERFYGRRDINNSLRIRMKERNNYDMEQIITARLDEPDMLPNPKRGSNQMEARDMIIRTLGRNANGSYALLQHKLDRVSRQLKMGASLEQLEAALDESSSSCDVAIKDLQQALPADHISQLNELLKWILFGQIQFTVPQLEAIMRALEETERECAEPEPNTQEIAELHLILGNCAYECGDPILAVEHYVSACSADKTNQAFRAHLGYLKAKFRMPDVDMKQLLKTTIGDELEDERNIGVLQMMARDSENDEIMSTILAVANQEADLLESVIRVLQRAVENLAPLDRHSSETALPSETYYDAGRIRGILLYHLGVAIYKHEKDAGETPKSASEAVTLWSDSRDQLAKVGGSNASIIGSQATSKLAKHYFQENRLEELIKLAKDNSRDYYNHPARLLGALYAQQGNKEESRKWLQRHVQRGLQNLSDDLDDNDLNGLYLIASAMLQYKDFKNAVVALSLQSEADLVTAALCFDLEDVEVENEDEEQRVLDVLERMVEDTVHATRVRVPDSARQLDRIDAAKEYIECLARASSCGIKYQEEVKDDSDVATTTARKLIQTRITDLKASHSPELDLTIFRRKWCDGPRHPTST